MRDDFCVFILTHGRPDKVHTYSTLLTSGCTAQIYFIIDDEDLTGKQYVKNYPNQCLFFSKSDISKTFDEGDNFKDRRAIIYARNSCHNLAVKLGFKYYMQFDDDYTTFGYRFNSDGHYKWTAVRETFDLIIDAMIQFLDCSTQITSVAMSQGGDHIGGSAGKKSIKPMRKAMNTFLCSTDKPFQFFGRINEDVNTYTCAQRRGDVLFFTHTGIQVNQLQTQSNTGGMTELYLDAGTYVKSFYSVMYAPSSVKISTIIDPKKGSNNARIHHHVSWKHTTPYIISDEHRKRSQIKKSTI